MLAAAPLSPALASPVSDHFVPAPHGDFPVSANSAPELRPSSGNPLDDFGGMVQQGYGFLGYSAFNGPQASKGSILDYAKHVGADVVVVGSRYTGSVSYGSIDSTTFSRFGSFSFLMPLTRDRYDQFVLFFVKAPHRGLGVELQGIKPSEAAQLGTNMGLRAMAIVRGSPAFMADVLPGDIITAVSDHPVYDGPSFKAALDAAYGTTARLAIIRNGRTLEKDIPLSTDGTWSEGAVLAPTPAPVSPPAESAATQVPKANQAGHAAADPKQAAPCLGLSSPTDPSAVICH